VVPKKEEGAGAVAEESELPEEAASVVSFAVAGQDQSAGTDEGGICLRKCCLFKLCFALVRLGSCFLTRKLFSGETSPRPLSEKSEASKSDSSKASLDSSSSRVTKARI